ncbi:MAG: DMP19 family protein [Terriglobales bacterium]
MPTAQLTSQEVEAEPFSIWNSFINLLAEYSYEELSAEQRPAHLVFWYESEVQNGGHLQYFENRGVEHLAETIAALGLVGASCQQQLLKEASTLFLGHPRKPIETVEEYVSIAMEDEFGVFDQGFGLCSPSLVSRLDYYLKTHQSIFVTIRS